MTERGIRSRPLYHFRARFESELVSIALLTNIADRQIKKPRAHLIHKGSKTLKTALIEQMPYHLSSTENSHNFKDIVIVRRL